MTLPWRPLPRRGLAAVAAALAALGCADARAQIGPEYTAEEIAFIAADTDGNNVITEGEMARDAARGVATLDKNASGTLAPEELGPHDAALFERVDTNDDGVLSFDEVMSNKVRALKEGDADGDGGLSFEEMVRIVETETGGAS